MYTIQAGSFVLNGQILLIFLFGLTGWASLRLYLRGQSNAERIGAIATNAFLIWFVVWKGSLILWDPVATWEQPISLLYYDGGEKGIWMAFIAVIAYVVWSTRKADFAPAVVAAAASVYILGGFMAYHIALALLDSENKFFHAGSAVLSIGMLLAFYMTDKPVGWRKLVVRWFWVMLGWTGIWFLYPSRDLILLSFSKQQIVGMVLGTVLFVIERRLERRNGS
ncbi:hypothetical protein [Paenibacillus sp. L3-i20]|uniref:hypothetical protein n=1 Tax=Paenibacillus sp. L3-i20 TaxID=2905833 RepID=UPI001EDE976B|nr:hypothetical protein [Paenibacillus sp. L3-i20]GKU79050.1 hypothetical protein L3i20_v234470 [Paenibacillus sp. L3-i20]